MHRRLLLTQFAATSIGRVISTLLQALSFTLLARNTLPSEFGIVTTFIGLALLAQAISDLGLSTFIIRERARSKTNGDVTYALHLNDRISILLALSTGLVLITLGICMSQRWFWLLPLCIWIAAEKNAMTWLGVAYADGDWSVNLWNLVGRRTVAIIVFVALESIVANVVLAFSLSWSVTSLLASWQAHRTVRPTLPSISTIPLRTLLRDSNHYWINSMGVQAKNLDLAIANLSAIPHEVGIFAAASRLTGPLRLLPTSLASALLPIASRDQSIPNRRLVRNISLLAMSVMTLLYGILFFTLPLLVPILLGEQYNESVPAMQVIMIGLPFAAGSSLLTSSLQAEGFKSVTAKISVGSTAIYLALVWYSFANLGATAAGAGMSVSFFLQFLALALFQRHFHKSSSTQSPVAPKSQPTMDLKR